MDFTFFQQHKNTIIIAAIVVIAIVSGVSLANSFLSGGSTLEKADNYRVAGKTALAIDLYKKVLARNPNNINARINYAKALMDSDEQDQAMEEFSYVIDSMGDNPRKPDAHLAIATIYMNAGEFEKAENTLAVFKMDPPKSVKTKKAELYLSWGDAKADENLRHEALEKYKEAYKNSDMLSPSQKLRLEKRIAVLFETLAEYHLARKEDDKAIDLLTSGLDVIKSAEVHAKLAEIYKKQNKMDKALEEYQKAYDLDSSPTVALYLSDLFIEKAIEANKNKKYEEAKGFFQQAQKLNPELIIPAEMIFNVALKNIKTHVTANKYTQEVYPKVSFELVNKSSQTINSLTAKVVFLLDGQELNYTEETLVFESDPLKPGKSVRNVTVASKSPVQTSINKNLVQAKIYLASDNSVNDWQLARTLAFSAKSTTLASNNKPVTVEKPSTQQPRKDNSSSIKANKHKKTVVASNTPTTKFKSDAEIGEHSKYITTRALTTTDFTKNKNTINKQPPQQQPKVSSNQPTKAVSTPPASYKPSVASPQPMPVPVPSNRNSNSHDVDLPPIY